VNHDEVPDDAYNDHNDALDHDGAYGDVYGGVCGDDVQRDGAYGNNVHLHNVDRDHAL